MPTDPIPRRTREPGGPARPHSPAGQQVGGGGWEDGPPDDLMSQFEAIGRMLEARREAQRSLDAETEAEVGAAAEVEAEGEIDAGAETARVESLGGPREASVSVPGGRASVSEPSAPVVSGDSTVGSAVAVQGVGELDLAAGSGVPAAAAGGAAAGPGAGAGAGVGSEGVRRSGASRRVRRNLIIVCAVIVALLAVGGGAVALVSGRHVASTGIAVAVHAGVSTPPAAPAATPDEIQAAQWVVDEVGPTHVVACDVSVCALLRAAGMPSASVVTVGSDISDVERADVLVSTGVVRRMFGQSLAAITSAQPLAVFGSGSDQVEVTAVALAGSGDYAQRLAVDRAARRQIGATLAHNARITLASPAAGTALSTGLVDSRLCSLLALLGATHKITVASFAGPGPGVGVDLPDPAMVLSTVDGQPAAGTSAPAQALLALLKAQDPPYRPMSVTAGVNGLTIAFAQPEPLGLISSAGP